MRHLELSKVKVIVLLSTLYLILVVTLYPIKQSDTSAVADFQYLYEIKKLSETQAEISAPIFEQLHQNEHIQKSLFTYLLFDPRMQEKSFLISINGYKFSYVPNLKGTDCETLTFANCIQIPNDVVQKKNEVHLYTDFFTELNSSIFIGLDFHLINEGNTKTLAQLHRFLFK